MADWGIKVSEPGYDVGTASDKNLSLKTGFTLVKVFSSGSVTMSTDPTNIAHNLGYYPQFLTWTTYPDYPDYEGLTTVLLATGKMDVGMAYMGTTNLSLSPAMGQGTDSPAKYYIFYEQLGTSGTTTGTVTADYGIKVTKDGYDIGTANILNQTFNSEKNSLKITHDGTLTSTGTGADAVSVAHGLSVIPGYMFYYKVDSGNWYSAGESESVSGKSVTVDGISETSNTYFQITRSGSCTVTIRYLLFADPGY